MTMLPARTMAAARTMAGARNTTAAEAPATTGGWRRDVDDVAPTVLLLGGFLTSPPFYRPMRSRLLDRGAAHVIVSGVWTPEWLLAGAIGLGAIVGRAASALRVATETASSSRLSRGAPLLVIGHSAGGMVARLLTSDQPFEGRRYALAGAMGAVVTLGTPHVVARGGRMRDRAGVAAARFADRVVPGPRFAPKVGYLAVGSRGIVGRPDGDGRARVAYRLYQAFLPEPGAAAIEGDGLVPLRSALLAGAPSIVLDGVVHGQAAGRPWYGTDRGLDGWWDAAVRTWRDALRARIEEPVAEAPLSAAADRR